jgi:hypothetical protein
MRISHDAMYEALFVEERGALGRELPNPIQAGASTALTVRRARRP